MDRNWYQKLGPAVAAAGCIWAVSVPAWAESGADGVQRQIEVTGEAQVSVVPDMATLTLGVTSFAPEAQIAMRETSRKMVDVIDKLVEAGVAAEDMQTSQLSLFPRWEQDRSYDSEGGRKLVGFEASNMLTIRLFDLDEVGPVLDQVLAVGANNFQGIQFGVRDSKALEDQLRAAAVKNAIAKAEILSDAAGADLGTVRTISDMGGHRGGPMMAMEAARSDFVPIAPGALEFQHSVTVVFGLEVAD